MDTNAEVDVPVCRETGVHFSESSLCIHSALYGVYRAPELRKDTIARRVRDAPPVLTNEPVEDRTPFCQAREGADLISAHETAVALHICCEDGDKASADFRGV